ncbi:MAG: hypothetical protein DSO08_02860, partial [Candidatus Methanomethylicota archaeon]
EDPSAREHPKHFFDLKLFNPSPFIRELKLWVFWAPFFMNSASLGKLKAGSAPRQVQHALSLSGVVPIRQGGRRSLNLMLKG